MKKVLLISVCLIVSVLLGGGKSWASGNVNFSISEGTLTINVSSETSNEDESSFASYLQSNNSFTKIVFTGGGKVSNNFVAKLSNCVSNVTSVDMGGGSYQRTFTKFHSYRLELCQHYRVCCSSDKN